MREAWRTWKMETARFRFADTARQWHLRGWFETWRDQVHRHVRARVVLHHIGYRLYVGWMHVGFWRWWRATRRRFRIVEVNGVRVLQEGDRWSPRSAMLTGN